MDVWVREWVDGRGGVWKCAILCINNMYRCTLSTCVNVVRGQPGVCICPSHIHHLTLTSDLMFWSLMPPSHYVLIVSFFTVVLVGGTSMKVTLAVLQQEVCSCHLWISPGQQRWVALWCHPHLCCGLGSVQVAEGYVAVHVKKPKYIHTYVGQLQIMFMLSVFTAPSTFGFISLDWSAQYSWRSNDSKSVLSTPQVVALFPSPLQHLQGSLALTPPTPTSSMVISVSHSPSRTVAQPHP